MALVGSASLISILLAEGVKLRMFSKKVGWKSRRVD
jgi:hypothetical protein